MSGAILWPAISLDLDDPARNSFAVFSAYDEELPQQLSGDSQDVGAGVELARKFQGHSFQVSSFKFGGPKVVYYLFMHVNFKSKLNLKLENSKLTSATVSTA